MPIWNGSSSTAREYSGVTERNRLGAPPPPPPPPPPGQSAAPVVVNVVVVADDETVAADETVVSASHGVSCSHDSPVTLNSKSGQHFAGDQLTNSKKFGMAEEALAGVIVITEEIPNTASSSSVTPATINTSTPGAPSKSYLRRLGDYLNMRRIRTASDSEDVDGGGVVGIEQEDGDAEELSNVIYRDSKDQVKMVHKQGNYVICDDQKKKKKKTSHEDSSDISDVDEREDGTVHQKTSQDLSKAPNGYLLPRVFLSKEG